MGQKRLLEQEEREGRAKKKGNKKKLKDAVNKIADIASLTNPEKRALKRALTDEET